MAAAREFLVQLVAECPDAPARTVARKAYALRPELFASLEACRTAVRRVLGVAGKKSRRYSSSKSLHRKPRQAGWCDVVPPSIEQLPGWGALQINGPHRALVLSDLHIPFHDEQAVALALEYGAKRKPTLIVLNGDMLDFYALSRWETDPRLRDFPAEVRAGRHFLAGLRKRFPRVRIVFKEGNHEERFVRYLRLKCAELLGVPEFDWENVYGLAQYKIELVKDKRPIRLGALNLLHGHEYVFQISNPVNPARGLFLRAQCHAVCGHFHQSSNHSQKNLEEKVVTTWSTGCLCQRPAYRPIQNWNHGAAFVELDKKNGFHVENFRIVDGRVW